MILSLFFSSSFLGFQGLCRYKQRITFKKAGDGFLFYALCDTSGYLYQFFPFFDPKLERHFDLSKTFSAVIQLCKHLPVGNEWHHLFVDNLYGNIKLAEHLLAMKIECTATMRKDRVPKALKFTGSTSLNDFISLYRNGVTVIKWMDKKEVTFLTTAKAHIPLQVVFTDRKRAITNPVTGKLTREFIPVPVLNVAKDYNYNMNGVDIQDQFRQVYNIKLRKRKWWLSIWFFLLETCICNAYLSYRTYMKVTGREADIMSHFDFRLKLAHQLAPVPKKRKKRSGGSKVRIEMEHYPSKVENNENGFWMTRDCVHCKKIRKERKRTIYECQYCCSALHPECFKDFHRNLDYEIEE